MPVWKKMYYYCSNGKSNKYSNNVFEVEDILLETENVSVELLNKRYKYVVRDKEIANPVIVKEKRSLDGKSFVYIVREKNIDEKIIDKKLIVKDILKEYCKTFILERMSYEKQNKILLMSKLDEDYYKPVFEFFNKTQQCYEYVKGLIEKANSLEDLQTIQESLSTHFVDPKGYFEEKVRELL